jgi:PiT family inorganic phosphate transporter
VAAFSAALTVYGMTRAGLPVSTSQAIVGAIIGWNLFSGFPTDTASLLKIVSTWVACPLLAGLIGVVLFKLTVGVVRWAKLHIYRLDAYTRLGLIVAGAFGSYALGANNIANVMGVFVSSNPFTSINLGAFASFSGVQQLFLLGAIAIAVGVYTYSKKVMLTVGSGLLPLSPVSAWVVVVSHSIVLFLFASQGLEHFLANAGLPTIPLVPVSSSQAVVGAVIGIGLLKGGKGIKWRVLTNIASGWVTTPIIACLVSFVTLFIVQNVFNQQVYTDASFVLSPPVIARLQEEGVDTQRLRDLEGKRFDSVREFRGALKDEMRPSGKVESKILDTARLNVTLIDSSKLWRLDNTSLTKAQVSSLWPLVGRRYDHLWMLDDALAELSDEWQSLPSTKTNKLFNRHLQDQRREVYDVFRITPEREE